MCGGGMVVSMLLNMGGIALMHVAHNKGQHQNEGNGETLSTFHVIKPEKIM